ncbi:MAG: phytanoyl-CoA dioxygenase family protein [Acidobacteriota bacterium]|nr:MAG: phytanoyl-CoA dioxygenase family protein [Acidobacteriota bacterium]
MQYQMGNRHFEAESKYLTLDLPDSNDILEDSDALRERMQRDGYLLIRGLHDAQEVLKARGDILRLMADESALDPNATLMAGVASTELEELASSSVRGREHLKTDSLKRVVYGKRVVSFFDRFLGGESLSYNFQWLRTTGHGAGSTIHYDVVYMGRGTQNLYTCWTPLGTVTPEMGPLVLCLGSNQWRDVIDTYGKTDVDRDLTCGYFSKDPAELVDKFGGRWATTTFEPGDVVILSMFMMHASLTNNSKKYRISCDTRYQLASEPVDDRWAGPQPRMHDAFWQPGAAIVPVEVSRERWGCDSSVVELVVEDENLHRVPLDAIEGHRLGSSV